MQVTAKRIVTDLESIKMAIAAKMDSAGFSSWIAPLKINVSATTLSMIAPNQFSADFIKSVYSGLSSFNNPNQKKFYPPDYVAIYPGRH